MKHHPERIEDRGRDRLEAKLRPEHVEVGDEFTLAPAFAQPGMQAGERGPKEDGLVFEFLRLILVTENGVELC